MPVAWAATVEGVAACGRLVLRRKRGDEETAVAASTGKFIY